MANQARKAIQDTSGDLTRLSAATKAAGTGAASMGRNTNGAFQSLGKWGNQLQWTGRQLQYNWTLPVLAAAGAATKFALDQDRAMTRVRKVYGDASMSSRQMTNETNALEKAFVALSNKYGVTIEDTANIAAEWAAAGATGLDLGKDVEQTMKTMVLGELDAAEATKSLIAIQAQYGFTATQLGDAMARLNAIENSTGTTTQDLITAMAKSAGVAREAGVSVTELGGMIAALTPAAGSASEAGNALKTMISRLLSPTGDAADILHEMGIEITDAGWQSMNATARFELLSDKFVLLTDSQKAVVSATIASRYHINKFSALMDEVQGKTSYYATALKVAGDNADYFGIAERELNKVLDSNAQKAKQVGVIIQNSMVKVIQPLLPLIIGMAQWIGNLAQKFSNLDPSIRKLIVVGFLFLAMLGIVARYVGSLATLISVLGRSFIWLGTPILGALRYFGLFRVGATAEMAATTATAAATSAGTIATMRAQFAAGFPGIVGLWGKFKNAIFLQALALNVRLGSLWVSMKAKLIFEWTVMWGLMQARMAARVTAMQAWLAAFMVPSFTGTIANLKAYMLAQWTMIWTAMTARMSAGWTWLRGVMLAGAAAFAGPFKAAWAFIAGGAQAIWAKLRFAFVAVDWSVRSLLIGGAKAFAAPFAAAWGAVARVARNLWAKLRFAFVAVDWSVRTVLVAGARAFAAPFAAAWSFVARTATAAWNVAYRGILAVSWAIYGPLKAITVAGGTMMRNLWAGLAFALRVQWMAFIAFMKTPGLLLGAFKSMGSAVMAGGRGIISLLAMLRTAVIGILTSPWGIAIAIVIALLMIFKKQIEQVWNNIKKYFADANNGIVQAFDALPNGIKNAFLKVVAFVKAAAQKVYEWMQYLNPFARHSPSLVDNVTNGLAVVRSQFGTLTQIAGPISQAYKGINDLKRASAGLRQGAASVQLAEDIKKLSETAPLVVPAFRALATQLTGLQAKADALEAAVNDQETTTKTWKMALDDASDALDRQQKILDDLKDVAGGYEDQINALNDSIQTLASTPLTGMGAMADAIFENELAQKRFRLEIMNMEDAGQTYDDVKNKIASLNGEIEGLRGTQNDLRAAGAGSDILAFYDDQIKAIEDQKGAMQEQVGPIAAASKAIDDLQRQAERLNLEQALQFDPLTRQIEKASSTMTEMPFDEVIGGINANKAALVPLQAAYDQASAAVRDQEANVRAAQAVHDQIQTSYDAEALKLGVLKDSYSEVSQAVSDVTSALSDMTAAADIAHQTADGAISPAVENFRAAAEGGDFANVGGNATIGGGPHGDQSAEIEDWTKGIEGDLGGAFSGLDMFGPFKDMWEKFKGWWNANVVPWFQPVISFFKTIFTGVDFFKPITDGWNKLTGDFDFGKFFEDIGNSISGFVQWIIDAFNSIWDLFGPDIMDTFGIIWQYLKDMWANLSTVFSQAKEMVGPFLDALGNIWTLIKPGLMMLVGYFMMVGQLAWSVFNGILGPALDWIGGLFMNLWQIVKGVFNFFIGLFTLDFGRMFGGLGDVLKGIFGLFWDTFVSLGAVIWGAIKGLASGLWDNMVWLAKQIWAGLGDGLKSGLTAVWGFFTGIFDAIIDFVKGLFGISSPSTVFAEIGSWLMEGLGAGIKGAFDFVVGVFKFLWSAVEVVFNVIVAIISTVVDIIVWYIKVWAGIITWLWSNVLQPVFAAIGTIFNWIWNNIISPIIGFIVEGIKTWAAIIGWIWENVISPIFGFIGDVFSWLWDTIISVIVGFIKLEIEGLGIIFNWLWDHVVKPVFEAIGAIFSWLWDNVAKPVFGFISGAFDALGTAIGWVWDHVIKPIFDGWVTIIQWLWNNILKPIWDAIKAAFDAMGTAMGWVWDHVLKPVFDTFGTVVSGLKSIFETVVSAIGTAWDGLKAIAAKPINFVIETVLNNGLIKAFNNVVGFFGLDSWKIANLTPVSFARGGPVKGYSATDTADNIPAYLTAKEYVQPVRAVKKYGIDFMDAVRQGRFPLELVRQYVGGFAGGGTVDTLEKIVKAKFPRATLNSGRRNSSDYHGRGMAGDFGELGFLGGAGRPYLAQIKGYLANAFPNSTELIYTGLGNKWDNLKNGRKHDYSDAINKAHTNHDHWAMTPEALLAAQANGDGADRGGTSFWDMLTDPIGTIEKAFTSLLSGVGSGKLADYVKETPGRIFEGVKDWVTDFIDFDTGGLLPSGGVGRNQSGSPERILSPAQTKSFDRLVTLLDRSGVPSPEVLEGVIFRATEKANRAETIGNQTIVNGDLGTTNITNNFYGDLSFPNITDPDDADTFLQNLSDLAPGSRQ